MFPFVDRVHYAGWFHVLYFGAVIPLLVVRSGRRRTVAQATTIGDRLARHYRVQLLTLLYLTALSLFLAWSEGMKLFPRAMPGWPAWSAGAVMYAAAIAFMRPRWRRAVEKRNEVVRLFMPRSAAERGWWISVSTLAGIGEEITWRGVQFGLLAAITGSAVVAGVLSAVSFGLGHFSQGWRSGVIIAGFALAFQGVVFVSGSLYVAMVVHVAYDITAGLNYARLARELGYFDAPPAAPAPEPA